MFDFAVLSNKVKGVLKAILNESPSSDTKDECLHIIETDYGHENFTKSIYERKADEKDPNMNTYGDFEDTVEFENCVGITCEIEAAVVENFAKQLKCKVIFPKDMMSRIAEDMIRMAISEPCGVRGCVINIVMKYKDKYQKIATVFGNTSIAPTFEIFLTLSEDNRSWKKFQKFFLTIKGCFLNSKWTSMPRILGSAYQLEKRRLYRGTYAVL